MSHITAVNCGLSGSTIFFHVISQTVQFAPQKNIDHKMCFDFLYNFRLKLFKFYDFSEILSYMYIDFDVKFPLFLSGFNETGIFSTDFRKIVKFKISRRAVQWEPSRSMRMDRHYEANTRFL